MSQEEENQDNNKDDKIYLLTNILRKNPNERNSFLPLIFRPNNINPFFAYLYFNNKENIEEKDFDINNHIITMNTKIHLLSSLMNIFKMNDNLLYLFLKKCKSNNKSFFDPFIDIYLDEFIVGECQTFIENSLQFIIEKVSVTKNMLEYIYQKISVYFRNGTKKKLTETLLLKYLNLLDLFYNYNLGENNNINNNVNNDIKDNLTSNNHVINEEKYEENNNEKEIVKPIKTFIYFNGLKNRLSLILNKNSTNINTDFPTLESGISIIFWINLSKELIESFFLINLGRVAIDLVNIIFGGHQIKLQLISINDLAFILDDYNSSGKINISKHFKYNEWNSFAFIIYPYKAVKLCINNEMIDVPVQYPPNFLFFLKEKINNITFFENLTGKISSLLFFSFSIDENEVVPFFNLVKEKGFYKNKYLYRFLLLNDKEYSQFTINSTYYEKYKLNINESAKNCGINLKEQNVKKLMCFLCPFCYDKEKNQIDDVFGNFIGILSPEDGVNVYSDFSKAIKQLGGINNLLPIAELMLLSQNNSNYNKKYNTYMNFELLDKNILTENTFSKYLIIIKKILIGHYYNFIDANQRRFFSSLGLFLEKFPINIYTEKILNIFLAIGKEIFQYNDIKESLPDNYVNMVLLNENIFSKFTDEIQQKLWEGVHEFFVSDYLQMKDSIPMSKICLLLRFYDGQRYEKFCCKKHADLFMPEGSDNDDDYKPNIMKPEMKTKINKLFETIQIYIEKLSNESETVNLFKLLSLDSSPCLQIKIIQVYQNFFSKIKIQYDIKKTVLETLVNNKFYDIFEYVMSVSLLDVRIELIDLLRIITAVFSNDERNVFENNINYSNFINFVGKNLIPTNLEVKMDLKEDDDIGKKERITFNIRSKQNDLLISTRANSRKSVGQNNFVSLVQYKLNHLEKDKEGQNENEEKDLLINYFNKKLYDKDVDNLWTILTDWLIEKPQRNLNDISNLKINSMVITFSVDFVSKTTPFYIDTLLITLYALMKNENISNKDELYLNKSFYPWLIETIYFFYDDENQKYFIDKDVIELIKQHSIELLKEYISPKRSKKEDEEKMNYLFDYLYHLKSNANNDEKFINKIEEITRFILNTFLEKSNLDMNIKTKYFFEFMIFFKNIDKYYNTQNFYMIGNFEEDANDPIRAKTGITPNKKPSLSPKAQSKDKKEEFNKVPTSKTSKNLIQDINNEKYEKFSDDDENNHFNSRKMSNDGNQNLLQSMNLIPDCIYNSLFLNEMKDNEKHTLKEIWKDFILYDHIIDNFKSNVWGIENLCKKVDLDYKGEFLKSCKDLIKEFNRNSKYKNILLKDLYNCLNFAQEEKRIADEKEKNKKTRREGKKLTIDSSSNLKKFSDKNTIKKSSLKNVAKFTEKELKEDKKSKKEEKLKPIAELKKEEKKNNKKKKK
jgi:hypothetical protein